MQCRYFGHIVIQQDPNSHQTSSSSSDGRILYPSVKYLNFPRLLKVGLPSKSHDNPWYCLAACNNVTNEKYKQMVRKEIKVVMVHWTHLGFSCRWIRLDQDLANAHVIAYSSQTGFHGSTRSQNGYATYLRTQHPIFSPDSFGFRSTVHFHQASLLDIQHRQELPQLFARKVASSMHYIPFSVDSKSQRIFVFTFPRLWSIIALHRIWIRP